MRLIQLLHPYRSGHRVLPLLCGAAALALAAPAGAVPDTVWVHCEVFDDQDGDGVRQPGEPGLASIRITNGLDVFLTDSLGVVDMPVDLEFYRFATMTVPAGRWPTTSFHHRLVASIRPWRVNPTTRNQASSSPPGSCTRDSVAVNGCPAQPSTGRRCQRPVASSTRSRWTPGG